MKHILLLCLSLLFTVGAGAQYYGVEINSSYKMPKDCGKIIYTTKKLYHYWPKKSIVKAYDWMIDHASNGRPESIQRNWISNPIDSVPGGNYEVSQDDGTMVVKGQQDKLHVYDLVTSTKTKVIELGEIGDFVLSGDGSFLAVARNGKVDLIDVATEKVIHSITTSADELKFSPGDKFLVLLKTQAVEIVNLWSGQSVKLEDLGFVRSCEMSINGRILIPHQSQNTLSYDVFDMLTGKELRKTIKKESPDWYYYSIHPRGEVLQVQGEFYTMKSKKPFYTSGNVGLKFHPFLPGVFVSNLRKGNVGTYFFKD